MIRDTSFDPFSLGDKDFTLVVLPDTQFYCDTRLKLSSQWGHGDLRRYFFKQTEWVKENQERLNISFVLHEGDIVQTDFPEEWEIAEEAMSVLDGSVPYCLCLGDHDMGFREDKGNKYGGEKAVNRETEFNHHFPLAKVAGRHEFGGAFEPGVHDNAWYQFEVVGMKFMVISLEFHPRDEALVWANDIIHDHSSHRVILLTHTYLKSDGTRDTEKVKLEGNNGEDIWTKLGKKHPNIFMILCGHHYGEALLTSLGEQGNSVYQILSDYQHLNDGGESWLRYMIFRPRENRISVFTYNPVLGEFKNDTSSRFDLPYLMEVKMS